jgi:hypothetical protein
MELVKAIAALCATHTGANYTSNAIKIQSRCQSYFAKSIIENRKFTNTQLLDLLYCMETKDDKKN